MKTFMIRSFLLNGLLMLPFLLFSQGGILNLDVIPANPGPEDSVSVVADVWLSSGSCWLVSHSGSISQDTLVELYGSFDSGMLTVICYTSDTFRLGRLDPGTYHVYYHMQHVSWPAFVNTQDMVFVVSGGSTGVDPVEKESVNFSVIHDPWAGQVHLKYRLVPGEEVRVLRVYSADGRLVQSLIPSEHPGQEIILPKPAHSGLFLYTLETSANNRYSCKFVLP